LLLGYNRAIGAQLGDTARRPWLLFDSGMLILQDNGRLAAAHISVDSVVDVIAARFKQVPGVARVERPADLLQADTLQDPVARRWRHQVPPDAGIVLVVTLQEPFVWGDESYAMHGGPSDADANVPLILMGAKWIKAGRYTQRAATVDIAPTLADLLRLSPLSILDGRVLREAFAPGR
jgi:arylsulfatase A-like enzyme